MIDKLLNVHFLIEQLFHNNRIVIDLPIHHTLLQLVFKEFNEFLWRHNQPDFTMESNAALLLIVINIVFIPNYFCSLQPVYLFFEGDDREDVLISICLHINLFDVIY